MDFRKTKDALDQILSQIILSFIKKAKNKLNKSREFQEFIVILSFFCNF